MPSVESDQELYFNISIGRNEDDVPDGPNVRNGYHLSKVCSLAGSASDISRFHGSLVRSIQRKVLAMVRKYSIRSMPAQANIRDASHCLASLLDGDSRFI